MEFYNRTDEIAVLREFEENSQNYAQMTLLMGRRRVGKTTLLRNAFTGKTERGKMESALNMPVGGFLDRLEKEYSWKLLGPQKGQRNRYCSRQRFGKALGFL